LLTGIIWSAIIITPFSIDFILSRATMNDLCTRQNFFEGRLSSIFEKLSFISNETEGTIFQIKLNKEFPADSAD
jgi:hypothetical protein